MLSTFKICWKYYTDIHVQTNYKDNMECYISYLSKGLIRIETVLKTEAWILFSFCLLFMIWLRNKPFLLILKLNVVTFFWMVRIGQASEAIVNTLCTRNLQHRTQILGPSSWLSFIVKSALLSTEFPTTSSILHR